MTQRRRRGESFSAAFTREVGRMTVGIWGLTRLGNTWRKLLTVPTAVLVLAVIYVALAWLVLAALGALIIFYLLAAIVLLILPGRVFRLRRLF